MSKSEENTGSLIDPIEDVIQSMAAGNLVVMVDDERRENEGDLICAAEHVTPELINFMATHGRGLICVSLTGDRLDTLGLNMMAVDRGNGHPFGTAFAESVDAREGVTTGISSADRAKTILCLIQEETRPADLIKPGHVFPLHAHPDGVVGRPGHTEAAVDLAREAGCKPAGVICEILKDDGSMARLGDLAEFAETHGLKLGSIADLIRHRQVRETFVRLENEIQLPTDHGEFTLASFKYASESDPHLALKLGDPAAQDAPLVRLHSECLTGDVFGSRRCDCGVQLHAAMDLVNKAGHGVILYMRQEGRGIGLGAKLHAYALQEEGLDTVEANEQLGFAADQRDYAPAAQMLKALGVTRVKLLTNNPAKVDGLRAYGIDVEQRIPCVVQTNVHNERYIETKKEKLGHLFD